MKLYADSEDVYIDASAMTTSAVGNLQLNLSPYGLTDRCLADNHNQVLGLIKTTNLSHVAVGSIKQDPSFYRTVALAAPGSTSSTCKLDVIATATLNWDLPDSHPDLVVLDNGPSDGASGAVVKTNGTTTGYIVASGDTLFSIANRFGISANDLAYLNPLTPEFIHAGDHVNLDKSMRGPWNGQS